MPGEPEQLQAIAQRALDYIQEGQVVGLGSGRASTAFIRALGERVQQGFVCRGIPTSLASERLAIELGIPLTTFDEVEQCDVDIDGADEIDPHWSSIKGYGGALLREKIVARASKKFILLVGDEKLVKQLGERGKLPVEAVDFGLAATQRAIRELGLEPVIRSKDGQRVKSDNGNVILDCNTGPIADAAELDILLRDIPGVIETGLFMNMTDVVLVQRGDGVETLTRPATS